MGESRRFIELLYKFIAPGISSKTPLCEFHRIFLSRFRPIVYQTFTMNPALFCFHSGFSFLPLSFSFTIYRTIKFQLFPPIGTFCSS